MKETAIKPVSGQGAENLLFLTDDQIRGGEPCVVSNCEVCSLSVHSVSNVC